MYSNIITILLVAVSDERVSTASAFCGPGYRMCEARSEGEALHCLLHGNFEVVVIHLGGRPLQGLQTAKSLRQGGTDAPMLLVVEGCLSGDELCCIVSLGNVDFLSMPFSADVIRAKVHLLAGQYRTQKELRWQAKNLEAINLQLANANLQLQKKLDVLADRLTKREREPYPRRGGALGWPMTEGAPAGISTILIAEDNPLTLGILADLASRDGFTVLTARNGSDAVALWERERPQIIFMDLMMPGVDGFRAARMIRARERQTGECVPIYALSAHSADEIIQGCRESGITGHIPKPMSLTMFREALRAGSRECVHPAGMSLVRTATVQGM